MLPVPLWRCPVCKDRLNEGENCFECTACDRTYATIAGIPDFRLSLSSWIDAERDAAVAQELAGSNLALSDLVEEVYSRREGWDRDRIKRRTREVLDGPKLLRYDLQGWLNPVVRDEPFLDLGCGGGMLMAAASERNPGIALVGIDVSMTWLVVAKKFVSESGGRPHLAAAMAEALPLPDDSLPAVVSLDVIEHVHDPDAYLAEINRVLKPGGRASLSTPNRFSLTAEPHVFVWGVGWLPQPIQARYVLWRSGKDYSDTILMSSFRLGRRLRRCTQLKFRILVPSIPAAHIAHFSRAKAAIARLFNPLSQSHALRPLFLLISPFFRVTGTKVAEMRERPLDFAGRLKEALGLGTLALQTQWGANW